MKKYLHRTLPALIVMAIAMTSFVIEGRKIRTRHSIPKTQSKNIEKKTPRKTEIISMESDSIDFCRRILPGIRFYGFDKQIGSNLESFFITNGLDSLICGVEVEITYTDMKGRQLHRRKVNVDCDIPAGETKHTDIKSWDTQRSFYFHRSLKPKRLATPFDVKLQLVSITLPLNDIQ